MEDDMMLDEQLQGEVEFSPGPQPTPAPKVTYVQRHSATQPGDGNTNPMAATTNDVSQQPPLVICDGNIPRENPQLKCAGRKTVDVILEVFAAARRDRRLEDLPLGALLVPESYTVNEHGLHSFQVYVGKAGTVYQCPVCPCPHQPSRLTFSYHLTQPYIWMHCSMDDGDAHTTLPIKFPPICAHGLQEPNHPRVPASITQMLMKMGCSITSLDHPWLRRANPLWITSVLMDAETITSKDIWYFRHLPVLVTQFLKLAYPDMYPTDADIPVSASAKFMESAIAPLIQEWVRCEDCSHWVWLRSLEHANVGWLSKWDKSRNTKTRFANVVFPYRLSMTGDVKQDTTLHSLLAHQTQALMIHSSDTLLFCELDAIKNEHPHTLNIFDRMAIIKDDVSHIPIADAEMRTQAFWFHLLHAGCWDNFAMYTYMRNIISYVIQKFNNPKELKNLIANRGAPMRLLLPSILAIYGAHLVSQDSDLPQFVWEGVRQSASMEVVNTNPTDLARVLYNLDAKIFVPPSFTSMLSWTQWPELSAFSEIGVVAKPMRTVAEWKADIQSASLGGSSTRAWPLPTTAAMELLEWEEANSTLTVKPQTIQSSIKATSSHEATCESDDTESVTSTQPTSIPVPLRIHQQRLFGVLRQRFPNLQIDTEVTLPIASVTASPGAILARVDFLIPKSESVIIVECDEHYHRGYDVGCEVRRMHDVAAVLRLQAHLPISLRQQWPLGVTGAIAFLRVNPHPALQSVDPFSSSMEQFKITADMLETLLENPADGIWYIGYPAARVELLKSRHGGEHA